MSEEALLNLICSRPHGIQEQFIPEELRILLPTLYQREGYFTDFEGRRIKKKLIWYKEVPSGKLWKASRAGTAVCQGQEKFPNKSFTNKFTNTSLVNRIIDVVGSVPTTVELSPSEKNLLAELYSFSSQRNWRFGKREDYLDNRSALETLKSKKINFEGKVIGLIFFKRSGAMIYWLPTRAGRAVHEGKIQVQGDTSFNFGANTDTPPEIEEETVSEGMGDEDGEIIGEPIQTVPPPPQPLPSVNKSSEPMITFWQDSGTNNIYKNYQIPYHVRPGVQGKAPTFEKAKEAVIRGAQKGIITHIIKMSEHPFTLWQDANFTQPFPVVKPDGTVVQAGDADEHRVDASVVALRKKGLSVFKKGPSKRNQRKRRKYA